MSKKEKTGKTVGKVVLGIGVAACLIGNLALGAYQLRESQANDKKILKYVDRQLKKQAEEAEKENSYQEDGYVVGDSYEIMSTKAISDAYKSGDVSKLSKKEKATEKQSKEILEKITKKCKTDYEKELAVYEWMYKNISNDSSNTISISNRASDTYTPAGVLGGKKAVCVGYATTFRMFMEMLGLECHVVHNDYHSWDLVKLDDNQWYHVDVYSDVSSSSKYANFNMPDGIAAAGHEWDGSGLPEATGVKYCYPVRNAVEIKDLYQVPAKVKQAITKKKSGLYFKFKNKVTDKDMALSETMMNDISNALAISDTLNGEISASAYWYDDGKDSYVLAIFISSYSDTPNDNSELDEKVVKKIRKLVSKTFDVRLTDDMEDVVDREEASKEK